MKVYAIGDLHLSFKDFVNPYIWDKVEEYKSMSIFGDNWNEHYKKLYYNWNEVVSNNDVILIPGDISWATTLEELKPDLAFIDMLPGEKVFIRGNHDYWWQSINKLRGIFPDNTYLIQNDSLKFGSLAIAGSRGWITPNEYQFSEHDYKIFKREIIRLELSLKSIKNADKILVMMHYMPVNDSHQYNELIELMQDYNVDICIYGHLHDQESHKNRLNGEKWGIEFQLVSADFLDFSPLEIVI
ncbi:MAG: metallophosphoesterase [Bacillota bacterium]